MKIKRMGKQTKVGAMLHLSGVDSASLKEMIVDHAALTSGAVGTLTYVLSKKNLLLAALAGIGSYVFLNGARKKRTIESKAINESNVVELIDTSSIEGPIVPSAEKEYSLPDVKLEVNTNANIPIPMPATPPQGITAGLGSAGGNLVNTVKEIVGLVPTPPLIPVQTVVPVQETVPATTSILQQTAQTLSETIGTIAQTPVAPMITKTTTVTSSTPTPVTTTTPTPTVTKSYSIVKESGPITLQRVETLPLSVSGIDRSIKRFARKLFKR